MKFLPIILAILLTGCAGEAVHRAPETAATPAKAPQAKQIVQRAPRVGGGYYLDDGPGDNPPDNLDSIPDAEPRMEKLIAACNKPYVAFGKTYTPETNRSPYHAEGVASWYGRRYHGQKTSSGEAYDMYQMSAAHPTLPIPSYARVSNPANGKAVIVRINDRGPFRADRLIDLSYTAAYKLGILQHGSSEVVVDAILPDADGNFQVATKTETVARDEPQTQDSTGIYLQLGAFSGRDNAESFVSRVRPQLAAVTADISISQANGLYKVHAGPFSSREQAQVTADKIAQSLDIKPVIVH